MTLPHLSIAYGDEPIERANVLAEILRVNGHEVVCHQEANAFLAAVEPDVYLIGRRLSDGTCGLDLLQSLRRMGRSAPVIVMHERPTFDDMRRAIELGAADLLLRPLESGELTQALARACKNSSPRPRIDLTPRPHSYERTYSIDDSTVGRAAREASAFLVNEGIANAHRIRIASAVAELVDNACRHAYPDSGGDVHVTLEVVGSKVQLFIADEGCGFDVVGTQLDRVPAALPSGSRDSRPLGSTTGMGRVERLCESHEFRSGPKGTRVELTFELTPVRFDEEPEDLAETDFLDPSRARSLVASLRQGKSDFSGVAPAMALTIGRLLGGIETEVRKASK